MKTNDHALLEAALIGYQHQIEQIESKMAELRQLLGGKSLAATTKSAVTAAPVAGKKRQMSAAARKRIAAAQKKRWAEYHKLKEGKE
jgi:hypothetical protein